MLLTILWQAFSDLGRSEQAVGWFSIYFNSKHCVQFSGLSSSFLSITKGVSRIVADTFMPLLDYGDFSAHSQLSLSQNSEIYHHQAYQWPSLSTHSTLPWYNFISAAHLFTHLHTTYTVLPQPPVPGIHLLLHSLGENYFFMKYWIPCLTVTWSCIASVALKVWRTKPWVIRHELLSTSFGFFCQNVIHN